LKRFEKKLKNRLKRNLQVVLEITDNLIEWVHVLEVELINTKNHLGAYDPLFQAMKLAEKLEDLEYYVAAGLSGVIKTGTLYYYN
jgi:hypothetical protein